MTLIFHKEKKNYQTVIHIRLSLEVCCKSPVKVCSATMHTYFYFYSNSKNESCSIYTTKTFSLSDSLTEIGLNLSDFYSLKTFDICN